MDQSADIVKYVIKSTPIGHLPQSLENLRNLIGSEMIESAPIQEEIVSYEEKHLKFLKTDDENKIVLTTHNKESPNTYHDQVKKIRVTINPLSDTPQTVEELGDSEFSQLRDDIYRHLEEYRQKSYKTEISAINGI